MTKVRRLVRGRLGFGGAVGVSALAASLGLAGCSGTSAAGESRPTVVVSTTIWADVIDNLLCGQDADQVSVVVLFDTNADPHTAEVHLSDRATLSDASAIVVNGAGLEATLYDTIDAVSADGIPVLDLSAALSDDVVDNDPHIWLDPTIVSASIAPLSTMLIDIGADEAAVKTCGDTYQQTLVELDTSISGRFATLTPQQRRLAVLHGLGYYCRRYALDVVATVDPGTDHASPSPASLAATIDAMQQQDVNVLATEVDHPDDDVNALRAAISDLVEVPLYIGGLGIDADADTYVEMMQTNTVRLANALDS